MRETLARCDMETGRRALQLTCVYGKLTPELAEKAPSGLHIMDACMAQLQLARRKCGPGSLLPARMDAEHLAYASDSFDRVILFFLLHEMPPAARERTLSEMLRVIRPGGRILITEYGEQPERHWLYRCVPFRWLLGRLEPFLPGFWEEDLDMRLGDAAGRHGKRIEAVPRVPVFSGFYRVVEYIVREAHSAASGGRPVSS